MELIKDNNGFEDQFESLNQEFYQDILKNQNNTYLEFIDFIGSSYRVKFKSEKAYTYFYLFYIIPRRGNLNQFMILLMKKMVDQNFLVLSP
jgi:hypothetical protein